MTTTPPTLSIGKWFREAREHAGYTQARAALAVGVSRPLITGWEKGTHTPTIEQVANMARVYDASWLFAVIADWYAARDSNSQPTDYGWLELPFSDVESIAAKVPA